MKVKWSSWFVKWKPCHPDSTLLSPYRALHQGGGDHPRLTPGVIQLMLFQSSYGSDSNLPLIAFSFHHPSLTVFQDSYDSCQTVPLQGTDELRVFRNYLFLFFMA